MIKALENAEYGHCLIDYIIARKLLSKDEESESYIRTLYVMICHPSISLNVIKRFVALCDSIFSQKKLQFTLQNEIGILEKIVELRDLDAFLFFLARITMYGVDRPCNLIHFAALNLTNRLTLLEFIYYNNLCTTPLFVAALLGKIDAIPPDKERALIRSNRNESAAFYAGLGNQPPFFSRLISLPGIPTQEKSQLCADFQSGLSIHCQHFPESKNTANQLSFTQSRLGLFSSTDTDIDEPPTPAPFEEEENSQTECITLPFLTNCLSGSQPK